MTRASTAGDEVDRPAAGISNRQANLALFGGAAALTLYLGFQAGGFFPDSTGLAAVAVAIVLIVRVGLVARPFGGLTPRAAVAVGSLALYAIWALVSSAWSHSPSRAVLEFDRVLLYLLVLVLFASLRRRRGRMTALAGGFGLASIALCVAALATRTLPAVFPIAAEVANDRLGYPLTYWNALGLLAALAILVCLGLSSSDAVPRGLRALAAAGVPVAGATLLLTFSRGAIATGLLGLLVFCVAARSRPLLLSLLATAPPTAVAVGAAYSATALATVDPTGPAAIAQGHHVALLVAASAFAALGLRALLMRWEQRGPAAGSRLSPSARRLIPAVAVLVALAAGGAAAATFDLPHALSAQYHRFVIGNKLQTAQLRTRLLDPANNGHLSTWRVALHAWEAQPLHGAGAGSYQNEWDQHRDETLDVVNAHSLYLEALADLGIVGLVLLLVALGTLVVGLAGALGGTNRVIAASIFAAAVTWVFSAAVDWDWQMPVVTWWLFAAGGLALARGGERRRALASPGRTGRLVVMVGIGALALLPAQVALSQLSLNRAVGAFKVGDCNAAVRYALKSAGEFGARADPYEVLGYCDARGGYRQLAVAMIQNAINRDPANWQFRYDMAIVRGLTGLDPRQSAREALALNPLSPLAGSLARALRTRDPREWRVRAAHAPLLI